MADLELTGVRKSFGSVDVIKGVDLSIKSGEFIVFVGPSGCGKSTLLRLIAGLEEITAGTLKIDGEVVNDLPPARRGIAMVFQSYALYPHMKVYDNMAFGMKLAGGGKAEVDKRVREAANMLQITPYLDRLPKQLSGGQRQRVAIGRAIVRDPHVFLFDEPLSNLDAALRVATRIEIAKLHERMPQTTMIYVTHDQVEAMTLADKIVVLDRGVISQVGTPMELYQQPANKFVASFIGSPTMNFVAATTKGTDGANVTVDLPGGHPITVKTRGAPQKTGNAPVEVGIRPEHVRLVGAGDPTASLPGTVQLLERLGNATIMYVDTPAGQIVVQDDGDAAAHTGENVGVLFDPARVHVFTADARAA